MEVLTRKGISPIVATVLLLAVAIIAVISFNDWITGYLSGSLSTAETASMSSSDGIFIERVIGETLYVSSDQNNQTIESLRVENSSCIANPLSLDSGVQSVSLSSCLSTLNSGKYELVLESEETLLAHSFYYSEASSSGSGNSNQLSLDFSASSTSLAYNSSTTLNWDTTNATSCSASGDWSGTKGISGSEQRDNLKSDKTYTLTCSNATTSVEQNVTVSVAAAPGNGTSQPLAVDFSANETSIGYNESITLNWNTTGADSCSASGDWSGSKGTNGTEIRSNLQADKTYTLSCANSTTTIDKNVSISVAAKPLNGTQVGYISATEGTVNQDWAYVEAYAGSTIENCTLNWNGFQLSMNKINATNCAINQTGEYDKPYDYNVTLKGSGWENTTSDKSVTFTEPTVSAALSPCVQNDSSLKLCYNFLTSGSDVTDLSAFGNDGSLLNGISTVNESGFEDYNPVAEFNDSQNEYISVPHSSELQNTGEITAEVWFRKDDLSNFRYLFNKDSEYSLGIEQNETIYSLIAGFGSVTSSQSVSSNSWNQLVMVFDSKGGTTDGYLQLYLNGERLVNNTGGSTITGGSSNISIGSDKGSSAFYTGYMAGMKIWNRSLSSQQVNDSYYGKKITPFLSASYNNGPNGEVQQQSVIINISASSPISSCTLVWNDVHFDMNVSGSECYKEMNGDINQTYDYFVSVDSNEGGHTETSNRSVTFKEASSFNVCPSDSNLVMCHTFSSVSGSTVNDESGNGNDGTLQNSAGIDNLNPITGDYLDLTTNSNAYFSIPHDATLDLSNGYTVGIWVKRVGGTNFEGLAKKGSNVDIYFDGSNNIQYSPPSSGTLTSQNLNEEWEYVVATFDVGSGGAGSGDETATFYVDGTEIDSKTDYLSISGNTDSIIIGERNSNYLSAHIDNVRVWDKVLSSSEITNYYNNVKN